MSRCRSCAAEVVWATSQTGNAMPLNAKPDPFGNVKTYGRPGELSAVVLAGSELEDARAAGLDLYMPHHATCPQGPAWRKKN